MKVADYIANNLIQREVTHVFGMSGANIENLFESVEKLNGQTQIVMAKNEYNAAMMAIGSYISTKKISVVLTTSGPGTLNTLPVLAEAFTSNIPLVLISGLVPSDFEGHGAFQDTSGKNGTIDIQEITKHCSTYQIKIKSPNEIPEALDKAFFLAKKNKKPSIVYIPKNIFTETITDLNTNFLPSLDTKLESVPDLSLIKYIDNLNKQKSAPPLLILGEDCISLEERSQLFKFIEKSGSAVALTSNSKGLFNHSNPQFAGLIGIMGHEEVNHYLAKTDYVIIIGSNLDMLNRFGLEENIKSKNILIIKDKRSEALFIPNASLVEVITGDYEQILKTLNSQITHKDPVAIEHNGTDISDIFGMKNIINLIQTNISKTDNIFIDAGNTGAFVVHNLNLSGEGNCYISLGMGGMGNSIGAGIGSAATSKVASHVFVGDGAFLMYGLEIHTAIEYSLPIHFYIFNNNSHGMCTTRENLFLEKESGINNFKKSNFALGLSKIFPDLIAHEVNNLDELSLSLEKTKNISKPTLISINIPNDELPPFKSFIK